ncbi:uncharacterized protein LOC115151088 isoform X6 [Salmo trutta]|uniref:uncharacterized protein LOC115151088 isoform X5 n=1 Tax=Salmo trutta TaxID=8032 RepID=UPI0011323A07|nr:uncharacterized protein LOC115151088 isoform X5 [Salmo trutta]XP_029550928.1 uncharacterized protein LOC115151088 isoform X6 [Salmo trutta]
MHHCSHVLRWVDRKSSDNTRICSCHFPAGKRNGPVFTRKGSSSTMAEEVDPDTSTMTEEVDPDTFTMAEAPPSSPSHRWPTGVHGEAPPEGSTVGRGFQNLVDWQGYGHPGPRPHR